MTDYRILGWDDSDDKFRVPQSKDRGTVDKLRAFHHSHVGSSVQFDALTGNSSSNDLVYAINNSEYTPSVGDVVNVDAYSSSAPKYPAVWECTSASESDVSAQFISGAFRVGGYQFELVDDINILAFGAKDGEDSTSAIADAIDSASEGGGTVIIPKGSFHITKITVKERVNLTGLGRNVSELVCTADQNDGAIILDNFYADREGWVGGFSLKRENRTKTGVGIWLRQFQRSEIRDVGIDGFERGYDTQGACWASKVFGGLVQYCTHGVYHHGADSSFVKAVDQTEPVDISKSGFNGGSFIGVEIRQNDYGVFFGDFDSGSEFHTSGLSYYGCIIEGNDVNGVRSSRGTGVNNITDCYFEANGRHSNGVDISTYVGNESSHEDGNVRAHISSISSNDSTVERLNISGCYFQNQSGDDVVAYFSNMAAGVHNINGNMGFLSTGVHWKQYNNDVRMGNTVIGPNQFNNTFLGNDANLSPNNSVCAGKEFQSRSDTGDQGAMTVTNRFTKRALIKVTCTFSSSEELLANDVEWPAEGFLTTPTVVATPVSYTLQDVSQSEIVARISDLNGNTFDVRVSAPSSAQDFVSSDEVEVHIIAEIL